jgi:selenide,water dikinase
VLSGLDLVHDPNLIVGLETADDAGVYKLTDEIAIIQTVDFFTPIVDDPYGFGEIAAANSLSDVYAMGGRPLCAMNIVCFPASQMPLAILREILQGGLAKLREAGVALAGGHSVEDPELKYGLSVTGIVHPARVRTNQGARPGDRLILTKPLGTGIVATAVKAELASEAAIAASFASMRTLNRAAAEALSGFTINACTDVTGFGLIGHAAEMVAGTHVGITIEASRLPLLPGAIAYAEMGLLPAGLHRNREYREPMTGIAAAVPLPLQDVLFDPQTSGGLLIAVPEREAARLLGRLRESGVHEAAIVAEVTADSPGRLRVV